MAAVSASTTVADALARFRSGETIEVAPAAPVTTPAAPAAARMKRISFPRPNGELYYARKVQGAAHDVDMLRRSVGMTVAENLYILAYGEPGTGKTAMIEAAFPILLYL